MNVSLHQSRPLVGQFNVPGDKSISHRALLCSALARGTSVLSGLLKSDDIRSTIECLVDLGVDIQSRGNEFVVHGKGLHGFTRSSRNLNAGNSGTTIRLLAGILAGQPFTSTLTGDASLLQRPMRRIVEPLEQMGATMQTSGEGTPPLTIAGKEPLSAISYKMPVPSAQVKSAVMFAALFADGTTTIVEPILSRDHTERMLSLALQGDGSERTIRVHPRNAPGPTEYRIPGDCSSAMFLICAALLVPGSRMVLPGVGLNPTRTKALELLRSLGADIVISPEGESAGELFGTLEIVSSRLSGAITLGPDIMPLVIDEIPVLAATIAVAGCSMEVRGAKELRHKESDRIRLLVTNLRAMGISTEEYDDGFAFEPKKSVIPTPFQTAGDHRIAMAFGVAALAMPGESVIAGAESASVSFPGFWEILSKFQ